MQQQDISDESVFSECSFLVENKIKKKKSQSKPRTFKEDIKGRIAIP